MLNAAKTEMNNLTQKTLSFADSNVLNFIPKLSHKNYRISQNGKSLIVTLLFLNPCTVKTDLVASDLPHPELVLRTFLAMCQTAA